MLQTPETAFSSDWSLGYNTLSGIFQPTVNFQISFFPFLNLEAGGRLSCSHACIRWITDVYLWKVLTHKADCIHQTWSIVPLGESESKRKTRWWMAQEKWLWLLTMWQLHLLPWSIFICHIYEIQQYDAFEVDRMNACALKHVDVCLQHAVTF